MKKRLAPLSCAFLCAFSLIGCTTNPPTSTATLQTTPTAEPSNSTNKPCSVVEPCEEDSIRADLSAYEGFTDTEHRFIEITLQELLDKFEKDETFVFFLSFPTCPWCIEALPVLNEVAKEVNQTVYYVNVRADVNDRDDLRQQLTEIMSDYLLTDEEGVKTLYVPDVASVRQGEIVMNHIDTVEGHDATERKMSEDEKEQLKGIYTEILTAIQE